jgi:hypothetical protein
MLASAGCGGQAASDVDAGDSDATATHDAAPHADAQDGVPANILGGVQVSDSGGVPVWIWGFTEWARPGMIFGVVGEGMWEPTLSVGDCIYLTAIQPGFCEPACDYDSYCDEEGECQLWPPRVDAGEMLLTGLAADITMVPNENSYYNVPGDTPDVMFTGGETATLTAEGNHLPSFELSTVTPEPLTADPPCDAELVAGQDFTVTWTPGSGTARVRWEMITMMHAGNGPMILCETADTGSVTVAGEIITRYLEDVTQWPTYQLSRYTRDIVDLGDGEHVALETLSKRYCFILP